MEPILIMLILLILVILGVHVAIALTLTGILGMILIGHSGSALGFLSTSPYIVATNYSFTVIPMFLFMAALGIRSGLVTSLFDAAKKWLGFLPGGLAIATTFASGAVAAMSGSSIAATALIAKMAVPEMKASGYSARLSLGVASSAGTFAIMIPPSLGLVLYAIITENSIGKLLIAGIIPGLLTIIVYCIVIFVWVRVRPQEAPHVDLSYSLKERVVSLSKVWPIVVLIIVILGSIFAGIATPSEAGAVGAFCMILIVSYFNKNIKRTGTALYDSLMDSIKPTAMIILTIMGASIMGYALVRSGFTRVFTEYIVSLNLHSFIIIIIFLLVFIVLGTIIAQIPLMFIMLPLIYPVVVSLGYDPIWFGILMIKTAEIGLITPPLGMNVYAAAGATGHRVETVFSGIIPFLLADVIVIALILLFPQIVLFIIRAM